MIKEELKRTQGKLNLAIRQHQVVIVQLRSDPKNGVIQKELRCAQLEICKWSALQKELVIKLRALIQSEQNENRFEQKLCYTKQQTIGKSKCLNLLVHKPHTPRPSILQGRKSVLRLQNEVPANIKAIPAEAPDMRHMLTSSMQTQAMTAKEFRKVEYMASLNLVTRERLRELENRRGERRRRSTAVPQFSYIHGHQYPETRKRSANEDLSALERKRSRIAAEQAKSKAAAASPILKRVEVATVKCGVCQQSGDMTTCHLCQTAYHADCLLVSIPPTCPSCQISREMALRNNEQAQRLASAHSSSSPSLQSQEQPQAYRAVLSDMQEEKDRCREKLEDTAKTLRSCAKRLLEESGRLGNIVTRKLDERREMRRTQDVTESRLQGLKNMISQLKNVKY